MDSKECTYCMQEMKKKQDPRQLPCGHVFCLNCMKDDFSSRALTGHQCTLCRRVYDDINFDCLLSGFIETDHNLETVTAGLFCDRCHNQPAVKYCIDCGEKSCAKHMEFHDGYYEGLHETLDIMKYAENPSLYNKAMICVHHKKECITMACKNCYRYNCLQCSKAPINCEGMYKDHSFVPLSTVEDSIKADLDRLLKLASDKLVEIEKIEKKAWQRMDELLVDCKNMIAEVETKSAEQIEQIQSRTAKVKVSIQQYQEEKTEQVVTFVTELMNKKEEIEEVRMSTHKFLRNKHVADLIKCKEEKTSVLTKVINMTLGTCSWTNRSLHTEKKTRLDVELRENAPAPYFSRTPRPRSFHWHN